MTNPKVTSHKRGFHKIERGHTQMALIKTTNITNPETLIKSVAKSGNVSATAIGILALILVNDSKNIKQDDLMAKSLLKRTRFIKARRELEEAGHLTIKKVGSRINYEWLVTESTK